MVKITVMGAAGRMGKNIITAIDANPEATLGGATEAPGHPNLGADAAALAGFEVSGVTVVEDTTDAIKASDVVIDFTTPEVSIRTAEIATELGKSIVIGTTGFSSAHREKITELAENNRIVLAPNMSVGVNLLLKLVEEAASVLHETFDIEIVEAHHRHKADAPSGTAIRIAEVAAFGAKRKLEDVAVYERKGIIGERTREEIGIQTLRAGDIVGDHTVLFGGDGERLELTHRAHSRMTFASGAVRAAVWVTKQDTGLFDMQDVLGLK
ncbi:MAG: 4-hydroxy-tetrahydrodipicolinate reductase [Deltaproteobacteria bacterium]|nr:4-hydroxy-tetrahydrodipicolinate reductase [Deltaproteobacteria bacterium]